MITLFVSNMAELATLTPAGQNLFMNQAISRSSFFDAKSRKAEQAGDLLNALRFAVWSNNYGAAAIQAGFLINSNQGIATWN
jgi:hypothetical protein